MGGAALAAALPYPGKATRIFPQRSTKKQHFFKGWGWGVCVCGGGGGGGVTLVCKEKTMTTPLGKSIFMLLNYICCLLLELWSSLTL